MFLFLIITACTSRTSYICHSSCPAINHCFLHKGFDSIVARGCVEPDPFMDTTLVIDGKKVAVLQTKEVQTGRQSSFHHNEFLVSYSHSH